MEFFKTKESYEYFCGLVISDGHMRQSTRNRGNVQIELKESDSGILEKLNKEILVNSSISERTRKSNFSEKFSSTTLRVYDLGFRNLMFESGIPYGPKSNVKIPEWAALNPNFWRGIIDGDGSLGSVNDGRCFISFVTKSESMALGFTKLIKFITGLDKTAKRNNRDGVFNLIVFSEDAQKIVSFLNYDSNFSIDRKREKALGVLNWKRPNNLKKKTWAVKRWTPEEDEFIKNYSIEESIIFLKRTKRSIKTRLWRLVNK